MVVLYKERDGKPCHEYLDTKRPWVDYTSVSVLKAHYAEVFNAREKAKSCSMKISGKYYGRSVPSILNEWDEKRKKGTTWGTFVHECIEDYLDSNCTYNGDSSSVRNIIDLFRPVAEQFNYKDFKVSSEKATWIDVCSADGAWTRRGIMDMCETGRELMIIKAVIETGRLNIRKNVSTLHELFKINKPMFIETACNYLLEKGFAGTIDIKLENSHGFYIHDIKTDEEIEMVGFNGKKMMGPLSFLDDCAFEKYSMQVNYYGLMEQFRTKKRFLGGEIIWIKKDGTREIKKVGNRQKAAGEAMKHFFMKNQIAA